MLDYVPSTLKVHQDTPQMISISSIMKQVDVDGSIDRYHFDRSFTLSGSIESKSMKTEISEEDSILVVSGKVIYESKNTTNSTYESSNISSTSSTSLGFAEGADTKAYRGPGRLIDIHKYGDFYKGNVYVKTRYTYYRAMQLVLDKQNIDYEEEEEEDIMVAYNKLREKKRCLETQAVAVNDTGYYYQVS